MGEFYFGPGYSVCRNITIKVYCHDVCSQGEDGAGAVIPSGGGGFEFGVDPNEDPELALALRVSMEENRARQAREEGATGATNMDTSTAEPGSAPTGTSNPFDKRKYQ